MKKIILFAMLICFVLNGTVSADIAGGVFIMKPKSNKAYFYNSEIMVGKSFYENRKSGCPYAAADGNVYVSAKNFFGSFGNGDEYFLDGDSLVIKLNGKKCTLPIGKKFAVRNYENEGNMYVYAFEGDYYIPSKLIAMLCDGRAYYDEESEYLALFSDSEYEKEVLDNGKISRDFFIKNVPYTFMNNSVKNSYYLSVDGKGIGKSDGSQCVFRLGNKLYYINDYLMYVKNGDEKPALLTFYDQNNMKNDIRIYTAVNVGSKIYGIATGNAFGKSGRVFSADTDGTDFKYIGTTTAENLLHVTDDKDYIYYMTSSKNPVLYLYDTECEDEYEVSIIDKNNNSLIKGMTKFAYTDKGLFAVINDAIVRFIEFDRPPHECEWIKIYDDKKIKDISSHTTGDFEEITVVNFDSINNILYLIDKTKNESRLVKISADKSKAEVLNTYDKEVTNINIFNTVEGVEVIVVFSDGSYESVIK